MRTIFLAHAEPDHDFALHLARFLEAGCDVTCFTDDLLRGGEDLIAKAEEGLTAEVLVLLLSESSCPVRWPRERWEPVLFEQTRDANVDLAAILLGDCPFPPLLRRRNFFDATSDRLRAMRLLKRWLWKRDASPVISSDLEDLYAELDDKPGKLEASGAAAARFREEASDDFEAVFWACHRRTLAQIAGELGSKLEITLGGTAEQDCRKIRDLLWGRRCLLVLDAPTPEFVEALVPQGGRTSTLVTLDAVSIVETPESLEYAQSLVSSRRYAEAYELLYRLLRSGIATESCARELTWICEAWDRVNEANALRFHYGPQPSEQLRLF